MSIVFVVLLAVLLGAGCTFLRPDPGNGGTVSTLSRSGRWFVDAHGRVVLFRGINFVQKQPPFFPAAVGFDDDDARFLAARGFNFVRVGVVFEALMPQPGLIDRDYIEHLATTVSALDRRGIYVLLDFHQDGWGPAVHGNGMPAWSTLTDGLPNPSVGFPAYYVQNPALQRAFDNFWANRAGSDGVPLQQHYAEGMRAVAKRFRTSRNVIGYEAMNEPWPGTNWSSCFTGCPDLEQSLLAPFYARMTDAVRSVDRRHPLFVEPFTLFNFGNASTSLPGSDSPDALSTHVYALDAASDAAAMDRSVEAAVRDHAPVLVTEWGATSDTGYITRTAEAFDARLLPWAFWAYQEQMIVDTTKPPAAANLRTGVVDALTRPAPTTVNGTPTALSFDATTNTLDFSYSTTRPDGKRAPFPWETEIAVPAARYPSGYTVTVDGAVVTSRPCAPTLRLRNLAHADTVSVHITRAAACS
jgi:endoglycosylceramidase